MSAHADRILERIAFVDFERQRRRADPVLQRSVDAIKHYQHARFQKTYQDLLSDRDYRPAAEFFLEDLYGPYDFSARDSQFAKLVPAIARVFPGDLVDTLENLASLHALTEDLDSRMAEVVASERVDARAYVLAWRAVGRQDDRIRQILWVRALGDALQGYTRKPFLRQSLRLMHRPAHAMGLGALQDFLETGFDTFRGLPDAGHFLRQVETRERALMESLFSTPASEVSAALLDQLP